MKKKKLESNYKKKKKMEKLTSRKQKDEKVILVQLNGKKRQQGEGVKIMKKKKK